MSEHETLGATGLPWPMRLVSRTVIGAGLLALAGWGAALRATDAAALDPAAILLRTLTLGALVYAAGRASLLVLHLRGRARAAGARLGLEPERIVLGTRSGEHALDRSDVIAIAEHTGADGIGRVFIATHARADALVIPACFGEAANALRERIERWRGPIEVPDDLEKPAPTGRPGEVYSAIARGELSPGELAIPGGRRWMTRAPLATAMLGAAVLEGAARASEVDLAGVGRILPVTVGAVLALVPLGWIALVRRVIAPRRGWAFVTTPAEAIFAVRGGTVRARWDDVAHVRIDAKLGGSFVEGPRPVRTIVIERRADPPIRIDEDFVGVPGELVVALGQAYRRGAVGAVADRRRGRSDVGEDIVPDGPGSGALEPAREQ